MQNGNGNSTSSFDVIKDAVTKSTIQISSQGNLDAKLTHSLIDISAMLGCPSEGYGIAMFFAPR